MDNKKQSFRGKENEMWAKVPVYMKKYFRAEISHIRNSLINWVLIFTVDYDTYNNQAPDKKWKSQIWIWNTKEKRWRSKIVMSDLSEESVEYYFIQHEYEKIILISRFVRGNAMIYSFDGTHIGEFPFKYEGGNPLLWRMLDEDTLFIVDNSTYSQFEYHIPTNTLIERLSLYGAIPVDELVKIYHFEKADVLVVKSLFHGHTKMYGVTVWSKHKDLSEKPNYRKASKIKNHLSGTQTNGTEMWLPYWPFFEGIEVSADEEYLYITGVKPIPWGRIPIPPSV